jgi:hypothetical protein
MNGSLIHNKSEVYRELEYGRHVSEYNFLQSKSLASQQCGSVSLKGTNEIHKAREMFSLAVEFLYKSL